MPEKSIHNVCVMVSLSKLSAAIIGLHIYTFCFQTKLVVAIYLTDKASILVYMKII